MATGFREIAIRASGRNFYLSLLLKGLLFAQVILFTRIFTPDEYGQLATVLLILAFATMLGRMGLNEAVVRESRSPTEILNTAFALSLWISTILFVMLFLLAPVLASVFDRPSLAFHVRVLALLVYAIPFELPTMLWVKDLRFGMSKAAPFLDLVASTVMTLVLHFGFRAGVTSLIAGRLAGFLVGHSVAWYLAPSRPRYSLRREHARTLYQFGWPLALMALFNFAIYQMDDVFVRLFRGDRELAFYTLAFALPYYLKEFTDMLVGALLPIYVRLGDDVERARNAFVQVNRYLTVAMVPCGMALFTLAEPATRFFFGERWLPAVPVLRLFALGFTLETLGGYAWGVLVIARGRTRINMLAKAVNAAFLLTGGAFLIWKFGALGGAWAMLAHAALSVAVVRPLILYRELGNLYYLRDTWKALGAAVTATLVVSLLMSQGLPDVAELVLLGPLFFALYAALYVVLDRAIVQDIRGIAEVLIGRR